MAREKLIPLSNVLKQTPPKLTCTCAHGKLRHQPHTATKNNYAIGVAVSSDICGPIAPKSIHGNSYFLTFIDTTSKYAFLYFYKRDNSSYNISKQYANSSSNIKSTQRN